MDTDGGECPAEGTLRPKNLKWSPGRATVTVAVSYLLLVGLLTLVGLTIVHVIAPVRHWDDTVNQWFAAHRSARWDQVSSIGTFVANTLGIVVVAAAVTALGLWRRWGRAAGLLAVGLGLELAVFLTTNYLVARPRPSARHLGPTPSTYSFPSGHVAAALVLYGGIALLVMVRSRHTVGAVAAWSIAALAVVWVGLSRVYEAQHHPTDVFAGVLMGIGALTGAYVAIRPGDPSRLDRTKAAPTADREPPVPQALSKVA